MENKPTKQGKKLGVGRKLTSQQESKIFKLIRTRRPWQTGFGSAYRDSSISLWNRDLVRQLIEKQCSTSLSDGGVADHLKRWGFPSIRSPMKPYERCSKHIRNWLDNNYSTLLERVRYDDAVIFWLSRVTMNEPEIDIHRTKSSTIIYVINNRGKVYWPVINGQFKPNAQIKLLDELIKENRRKVFLIRENLDYFTNGEVMSWLSLHTDRIELFPPPSWVPAEAHVVKA